MKLRSVLSIIYLHAYQSSDPYDLLFEEMTKPMKPPPAEQMKAAAENEFFYLTFSQYVSLNKRPEQKLPDVIKLIQDSDNYEDVRAELARHPVTREEDAELLAGLKSTMESIEQMRNCVAHNRKPSNKAAGNYTNALQVVNEMLDNYLKWCLG